MKSDPNPAAALKKVVQLIRRETGEQDRSALIASPREGDEVSKIAQLVRDQVDDLEIQEAAAYLSCPPATTGQQTPAVLVAVAGSSGRRDLEKAKQALLDDGYRLLGIVLVGAVDPLPRFLRKWFPAS